MGGSISNNISNLVLAEKLTFRENYFHGAIPSAIGTLINLENLRFNYNEFTGSMPQEVCDLLDITLEDLISDCDDTLGNAAIECDCCTDCCDNVQKVCYEQ